MHVAGTCTVALLFVWLSCCGVSLSDARLTRVSEKARSNGTSRSWTSGVTSLTGKPEEYILRQAGAIMNYSGILDEQHIVPSAFHDRILLPKSFDARLRWPKCQSIRRVFEQGFCGSCWAVAGATAISDRICIASKYQNLDVQLSPQDPLICSGGTTNLCVGGYAKAPYIMYVESGLVTGGPYNSDTGCMPYDAYPKEVAATTNSLNCSKTCENTNYQKTYLQDKYYGENWYALGNLFVGNPGGAASQLNSESVVRQIQYELMTNGPLTVTIMLYYDMINYSSGVYRHESGDRIGGHAMKVIGWGRENHVDYWLLANSWGTQWGLGGFLKFVRGENHLGIEDYLVAGTPQQISTGLVIMSPTTPCDNTTVDQCGGKDSYAMHPLNICADEWCNCLGEAPVREQCREGLSFDADPSVYMCVDTETVPACI